ncbi:hypothetical protein GOA98_24580 [Sinorhizobium meliloti]|nr:hypothetical protein [Sinorhizobium meliloti]
MWPPAKEFWIDEFPAATEHGVKPYLFKAILPEQLQGENLLTNTLRDGSLKAACESGSAKARVYIEEDRREDLLDRVVSGQIEAKETLEAYIRRITGEERFGFVVNNLERVSAPLAEQLGLFLASMFEVRGMPLGGVEQVSFAGNYSSTAFGIHEGFEHAFLCHFGPGTKLFYCWSQATYLQLNNGSRAPTFGDFTDWLQYGELFIMEPGDILYLPARVYHVGRQSEFSLSVALPLYTYPTPRFLSKVILASLIAEVPFDQEGMSDLISPDRIGVLHDVIAREAHDLFEHWGSTGIGNLLQQYVLKLMSNGGWEIINKPSAQFDDLLPGTALSDPASYSLPRPYRTLWQHGLDCGADEVRVFLRGESKVFKARPDILAFLKAQENTVVSADYVKAL